MKTKLHRAITALLFALCPILSASAAENPNVSIILADDLGYGDVRCYSPERGNIPTPHLDALEKSATAEKKLVIFTSDNGCAPYVGAKELEAKGHFPSGQMRGYKDDAWEGGHRVPFIVRWPGVVKANTRCDVLVQQTDLMATLAETLGAKLPDNAGEDSVSLMPLLKGGDKPVRECAISHASSGLPALRKDAWKIIFGQNGGGLGGAPGVAETGQIYDLATDRKPNIVFILVDDMPWFGTPVRMDADMPASADQGKTCQLRGTAHIAESETRGADC